jgi:putative transposase
MVANDKILGENWFGACQETLASGAVKCQWDDGLLLKWLKTLDGGKQQLKALTSSRLLETRKIRVDPATPQQGELLRKWFGTARWTYNQCLTRLNDEPKTYKATKSGGLREAVVNDDKYKQVNKWVLETPRDIRAGAYIDLINAVKSNEAKKRKNPNHKYSLHYRSKKAPQERIYIDKRAYKNGAIYIKKFGTTPLRSHEPLPETLQYDAHLIRDRLGRYFLCISYPKRPIRAAKSDNQARIAALDPGVRTFQTLYDPSGKIIEFGKASIGHIYRICHYMDALRSDIDLLPTRLGNADLKKYVHRKRWRMRRAWHRMAKRVRNLVDDCHKRMAHYLVTRYDVVLLPKFETSRMILRKLRKLNAKAVRAMVTWSHFRFRQRLLDKCLRSPCKVIICDEAYTSKTCGRCGWLNDKLGGNKVYACKKCHLVLDRDVNGARNILLKHSSRLGLRV